MDRVGPMVGALRAVALPRRSPALRRGALLGALLVLSGCTGLAMDMEQHAADSAPDASYRAVAIGHLRSTFKDYPSFTGVEISEARWVHSTNGWGWLACAHFQDQGHRRTYAMLIRDKAVVASRFAVQTDACDAVAFSPAEQPTGTVPPPPGTGLSPLY